MMFLGIGLGRCKRDRIIYHFVPNATALHHKENSNAGQSVQYVQPKNGNW